MKRTERRHLKENELAQTIASTREFIEQQRRPIAGALIVIFLIAVALGGMLIVRQRTQARAAGMLADALVALNARVVPVTAAPAAPGELPAAATMGATGAFATEDAKLNAALPKLKAAADAYPDSEPGLTARYHYASALATLGKTQDAIAAFDDVAKRAGGSSLYGRMASLGKADTQARAQQFDAAIATWKELAAKKDAQLPQDAILMELARAYQAKGNRDEARKTYTQIVDDYPSSVYTPEAKKELDRLKG